MAGTLGTSHAEWITREVFQKRPSEHAQKQHARPRMLHKCNLATFNALASDASQVSTCALRVRPSV